MERAKLKKGLRIAAMVLLVLFWLVMVGCSWANHVSPIDSVIAPLAYMFSPVMMILGAVLVLLTFLWHKKLALAGCVFVACCLPQALTFCPLHFGRKIVDESVSADVFSVMTFNPYHLISYLSPERDSIACDMALQAVLQADPDIVLFQEITGYDPFIAWRKRVRPELREQINKYYPYKAFSLPSNGIISKYPLRVVPLPNYNITGDTSFSIQRVEIEIGDSVVNLFNVHLQSLFLSPEELRVVSQIIGGNPAQVAEARGVMMNKIRRAYRNRALQAQVIRNFIDSVADKPTIVAGDFNDVPGCWAVRTIEGEDFNDVFAAAGLGPSITYRKHNLYFRIDQMLCSKSLKPLGSKVLRVGESDHYPLFTLFAFRNEN